jgi:hypothetical protein
LCARARLGARFINRAGGPTTEGAKDAEKRRAREKTGVRATASSPRALRPASPRGQMGKLDQPGQVGKEPVTMPSKLRHNDADQG